ncbi:PepSY domain-containing protein [Roseibium sp. AS2]|uniref:PepSY domain-containing protein n=1 Tax=Roseibium sp. AS2 TaxID=3135781 RepID=UPI0031774D8A
MKTSIMAVTAIIAFSTSVFAAGEEEVSVETEAAIMAKLTAMECQMAPDDIEVTEDGFELDNVICKGGKQFDIELDGDLNETGRRAE